MKSAMHALPKIFAVITMIILPILTQELAATPVTVTVPDTQLEAAIRNALNKPTGEITSDELLTLTTLEAVDQQIEDLTGLEFATNLTSLDLSENVIADLSPLSNLTVLNELLLRDNAISSLSPISGLKNLKVLNLSTNRISEIEAISGLFNLEQLYLDSNLLYDIRALSNLNQLNTLYLGNTAVESYGIPDINALKNLTGLRSLSLSNNTRVDDLSIIGNLINLEFLDLGFVYLNNNEAAQLIHLTKLQYLFLDGNPISQLNFLGSLQNLKHLNLSQCSQIGEDLSALAESTQLLQLILRSASIHNLTFAQSLTNLTLLDLRDNLIADPSPISTLTAITDLNLSNNPISNFDSLSSLINLDSLSITGTAITEISTIENLLGKLDQLTSFSLNGTQINDLTSLASRLSNLTDLALDDNNITDISELANLTNLTSLSLNKNNISNIGPLSNLANLTKIEINENQITNINPLSALTQLTRLGLQINQIENLSDLSNLKNLTSLALNFNKIVDIEPISELTNLTYLGLDYNQLVDIAPLANLKRLNILSLSENSISDISVFRNFKNLLFFRIPRNYISDLTPILSLQKLRGYQFIDHHYIPLQSMVEGLNITWQDWLDSQHGLLAFSGIPKDEQYKIAFIPESLFSNKISIPFRIILPAYTNLNNPNIQFTNIPDWISIQLTSKNISGTRAKVFTYDYVIHIEENLGREIRTANITALGSTYTITQRGTLTPYTFKDKNLETTIRLELSKGTADIIEEDIFNLKELNASNRNIQDLSGLEFAVNLETLDLSGNQITNIKALAKLKNIQTLNINTNPLLSYKDTIAQLQLIDGINIIFDSSDSDADGLLDFFEQYIINHNPDDAHATFQDVAPLDDFDGDGRSNISEQADEYDPTDFTSPSGKWPLKPTLNLIQENEGNVVLQLTFEAGKGSRYWLGISDDPTTQKFKGIEIQPNQKFYQSQKAQEMISLNLNHIDYENGLFFMIKVD